MQYPGGHHGASTGALLPRVDGPLDPSPTRPDDPARRLDLAAAALMAVGCGVVITDARRPGLPIVYVNRGFEKLTGYRAEEVIGQSCAMLQGGDNAQPGLQTLRDALRQGRGCSVVLRNYTRDGALFVNELQISPILGADGRPDYFIGVQNDVTEKVNAQQRVHEVLERIDEAFITLDASWHFTYVNPSAERLLQRSARALLGAVIWAAFPDVVGTVVQQRYEQALKTQQAVTFSDYFPRLGKWFEIRAFPLSEGLTVFFRDITRQKDHDARLEYQASHDTGTGLWNQRSLLRELSLRLPEARRRGQPTGVIVLAIQGHRDLAAHHGHAVANQLVRVLAQRLRASMTADAAIARTAEDEFTLLVPAPDSGGLASQAAEWLRALSAPMLLGAHRLRADLVAGTACQGEDGVDASELLANAKVALAAAMGTAATTAMAFDRRMRDAAARRLLLLNEMRHEQFLSQLTLLFQPQFRVSDGALIGLEALLRWHSPTLGAVSPGEFVPLAEGSDLIDAVGRWVIGSVCRQLVVWRQAGLAPPPVSLNASAREVLRADYAPTLLQTLREHGLGSDSVCVEVTESVAVDGFEHIQPTLALLSQGGVQVHLDDFGQGYCNLRRLQWLDIHTLKIDRSLVVGMDTDPAARAMLRAVVELGHSLNKAVLVEGIETEGELAVAREVGCDIAQGYLLGRPQPAAALVLPAAGGG